jgi:hypothetical protein
MSHKTFRQTFAEDMLHVCVFVCMCAVSVFVSLNHGLNIPVFPHSCYTVFHVLKGPLHEHEFNRSLSVEFL